MSPSHLFNHCRHFMTLTGKNNVVKKAFSRLTLNNFVESNRKLRWCPGTGCEMAVKVRNGHSSKMQKLLRWGECSKCAQTHLAQQSKQILHNRWSLRGVTYWFIPGRKRNARGGVLVQVPLLLRVRQGVARADGLRVSYFYGTWPYLCTPPGVVDSRQL